MKLNEILNEYAVSDLEKGTNNIFPNRKPKSKSIIVRNKQYIKYDNDKILVKANVRGQTSNYVSSILFVDVKFTNPAENQSVKLGSYHISPLTTIQPGKISCTCEDFKWTFAWSNAKKDALDGNPPPPYKRKTNRPPRNPTETAGMCKHLLKLYSDIQAEMYVEQPSIPNNIPGSDPTSKFSTDTIPA